MEFLRPSQISLCTFIPSEMLNTESCRDKVLIFLRNPFHHDWNDLRYGRVSTCNCEHPTRDPFSTAKSSYMSVNYIQMQLNYLYTADSEAIFSSFGGGVAYGGAQSVSRPEKETGILFLGKNWLDYIGEIMSKSGE